MTHKTFNNKLIDIIGNILTRQGVLRYKCEKIEPDSYMGKPMEDMTDDELVSIILEITKVKP